ncbi:hypothetical protein PWT90_08227 [Aphanocladium album]|nr:hypothetical protein PWT90_08227 [Aphanocladium album]
MKFRLLGQEMPDIMDIPTGSLAAKPQALPSTRDELSNDAPELLALLDLSPGILIYSKSSSNFHHIWLSPTCRLAGYPRVIICPRSEFEVSLVLRLASGLLDGMTKGSRLPLAIRGGGHDSFGRSSAADGIVLDTRHLDTIEMSDDAQTVLVGSGVLAGTLLPFLSKHGVFAPVGYCSTVGYAGWCLGGGFGVFTASYGAGAEGVVSAKLVTADGRIVRSEDDPELFWGLRGAGNGNFGVVTELRIKTYPEPKILGGYIGFPIADAEAILGGFRENLEDGIPDEFNGDIIWAPVPGVGPLLLFMYVWTAKGRDDLTAGWSYMRRIEALGNSVLNSITETTPAQFLHTLNGTFKDFTGAPCYVQSPTVATHSRELGRIIAARPVLSSGHAVGGTHFVHGVVEKDNPSVALPNTRHITITLFGAAEKEHANDGPEMKLVREWIDGFAGDVQAAGIALPPSYVSFSKSDIDLDKYYGEKDARRLRALKKKYDAQNLFFMAYPTMHT